MKRILLLMAVVLSAFSMQAQRTISGKVVDEANEGVIQATVSLLKADSTSVSHAVTNMNGQFSLTAPADGKYIVRVTYVGYKTTYKNLTVEGKPADLGTMSLKVDAVMLKGAEVVKNMARVYSKGDTVVYNAGAYKTPEGSVVEELVKRLPGAQVSDDGRQYENSLLVGYCLDESCPVAFCILIEERESWDITTAQIAKVLLDSLTGNI